MIDALIQGKVYGQPQTRTDANGKPYSFGKIRAAAGNGEGVFVSVIVFGQAALQFEALQDGDAVALLGSLTPKAYADKATGEPRAALDMQVLQVMTPYQLSKRRGKVAGEG